MASDFASDTDRRDAEPASELSAPGLLHCDVLKQKALAAIAALVAAAVLCAEFAAVAQAYVGSEQRVNVHGITFVLKEYNWNSKDGMLLQAWRKGKRLLEKRGHRFFLYCFDKEEQPLDIDSSTKIPTADFNGDGVQDIIIEEWTGGAHCCYTFEIYSLNASSSHRGSSLHGDSSPQLTRLWRHEAGHGHLKVFSNKHGLPTLSVEDSTFAYWGPFGFADSPRPPVYLRWVRGGPRRGGGYQIDRAKMRRPFDAGRFAEVRKEPMDADASKFFIEEMYKGNAAQAINLWSDLPAKDRQYCFSSFLKQFKTSPFYYQLVKFNGSKPIAEIQRFASGL